MYYLGKDKARWLEPVGFSLLLGWAGTRPGVIVAFVLHR